MSDFQKDLEILALRSQLAVLQRHIINKQIKRPHVDNRFRRLWVILSKILPGWESALMLFRPETVIGWHKRASKLYWRRKTKGGRPIISHATISLIKQIHKDNPTLSPEKIHERLIALNITDAPSPNTIAKYIKNSNKPSASKYKQSWQSFLTNQSKHIWSMDFAIVPTITFKLLYDLFIISHDRLKIEHFAVTRHPTAEWVTQQLRNATPFGKHPKYLIHDNEPAFEYGATN
jgi:hypothetical protein